MLHCAMYISLGAALIVDYEGEMEGGGGQKYMRNTLSIIASE